MSISSCMEQLWPITRIHNSKTQIIPDPRTQYTMWKSLTTLKIVNGALYLRFNNIKFRNADLTVPQIEAYQRISSQTATTIHALIWRQCHVSSCSSHNLFTDHKQHNFDRSLFKNKRSNLHKIKITTSDILLPMGSSWIGQKFLKVQFQNLKFSAFLH